MNQVPPVLLRYIHGLETRNVAEIAGTVADGLAFISNTRTLSKQQFLAFLTALYAAFPDWHYEHDEPKLCTDGSIEIAWRQGGTHTSRLALPGSPAVAATGKVVQMPRQLFFYRVAGEQLVEIRPQPIPGGAPRGILEQIGVADPLL